MTVLALPSMRLDFSGSPSEVPALSLSVHPALVGPSTMLNLHGNV